jgi:MHS family proline/betaine transporter-like MFS transporter
VAATATRDSQQDQRQKLSVLSLVAGLIGNILEWYDFGLYGYFAPLIAARFFPAHDAILSLLAAYAGFAVGFAMRPFGALVFGHIGDRVGRRTVLVISVTLMGVATTAIGLLPNFRMAGLWAPVLLLVVRLFQGFSVGGEFTGSVSYLIETAPANRRGYAGSYANIGSTGGYLLAAAMAAVTMAVIHLHPSWLWAWRLPFLGGGLIAALALWLRRRLPSSAYEPDPPAPGETLPVLKAFQSSPRILVLVMLLTWGYGVVNYLTMVFLPTFASHFGSITPATALTLNTIADAVAILMVPVAGLLSDTSMRRRTLLLLAFGTFFVTAYAFFALALKATIVAVAVAQLGFGAMLGAVMGAAPAMLAEAFHAEFRLSGYSLAFNFGLGLGGGTAPLIATALIGVSGMTMAPAFYLMFGALLAIIALYFMPDRSREPLL